MSQKPLVQTGRRVKKHQFRQQDK